MRIDIFVAPIDNIEYMYIKRTLPTTVTGKRFGIRPNEY